LGDVFTNIANPLETMFSHLLSLLTIRKPLKCAWKCDFKGKKYHFKPNCKKIVLFGNAFLKKLQGKKVQIASKRVFFFFFSKRAIFKSKL
jgi:hypothetical protein